MDEDRLQLKLPRRSEMCRRASAKIPSRSSAEPADARPLDQARKRTKTYRTLLEVGAVKQPSALRLDVGEALAEPGDFSVELGEDLFQLG